jgi:phosphatidate cytidylyltransferase
MLLQRVIVSVVLLPFGITAIVIGGPLFAVVIALILGLAAWEYVQLFRRDKLEPSGLMIILGTWILIVSRFLYDFEHDPLLVPLIGLSIMAFHMISFERGRTLAATDFAVTIGGLFYFGLIGSFFISLRGLENGHWWTLIILPSTWLSDSGAYFIGKGLGKRKLAPRLSPNKTWEGYIGGILVGVLGTPLLLLLYRQLGLASDFPLTLVQSVLLGFVMGVLPPLGDLGESMFKRQVGAKDSSNLLPGHGGAFDRIDSWLWAVVIGYWYIQYFILS